MYAELCFLLCLSQLSHAQLSFCLPVYTYAYTYLYTHLYVYTPKHLDAPIYTIFLHPKSPKVTAFVCEKMGLLKIDDFRLIFGFLFLS